MTRTRKPRRKVTTDLGRSVMQRERQRLAREQAVLAEKLAEDALRARKAGRRSAQPTPKDIKEAASRALQRSVVRRIGAVLASEGVHATLSAEQLDDEESINAWTDFKRIYVGYHWLGDVRETAAVLRGAFYHEGGHCRWTLPYASLEIQAAAEARVDVHVLRAGISVDDLHMSWNALEDQRMETAVTSDSPRKAGYFTPMIMAEMCPTLDTMADNWPLLVWRRYLPSKLVREARRMFVGKYAMRGLDGEAIATQIENVVDRYVNATDARTMFEAVIDMHHAMRQIDPPAYDLSDQNAGHDHQYRNMNDLDNVLVIPIDPSMLDGGPQGPQGPAPTDLDELFAAGGEAAVEHVMEILAALMFSPETLITVVYGVPQPSKGQGKGGSKSKRPGQRGKGMSQDADDEQEDGDEGEGDEDAENTKSGKGKNAQAGRKRNADGTRQSVAPSAQGSDTPTPVPDDNPEAETTNESDHTQAGDSKGTHGDDGSGAFYDNDQDFDRDGELTNDDLEQMFKDAKAERNKDSALDGDVNSFGMAHDEAGSNLDIYTGGVDNDPGRVSSANRLAEELVRAFEQQTVEKLPQWEEEQRRGIVNVLRYKTRQPGNVEFFRDWQDEGQPGTDCAVSLLLDYSGSMGGSTQALAQVAYGCKKACDQLDIPCTVILWDTDARVLWDAEEHAEYLPIINSAGGTNPIKALSDVKHHRKDKSHHVVMVMTDDAWESNSPLVNAYREDGSIWLGLGYTSGGYSSHIGESMERKGFDHAYSITDLFSIPKFLEGLLVDLA